MCVCVCLCVCLHVCVSPCVCVSMCVCPQMFTVQVSEEQGARDLGEIRDLARRLAMSFGIDLQRVRSPLLALHTYAALPLLLHPPLHYPAGLLLHLS